MKKIRFYRKIVSYLSASTLLFLAAFMIYTGCNKEETTLNVSTNSLHFKYSGEDKDFTVTSNNKWTVTKTDGVSWINVSPSSGSANGTVKVLAAQNMNMGSRSSTIIVSNNINEQVINVMQEGLPDLSIEMIAVQGGTFNMGCTLHPDGYCSSEQDVDCILWQPGDCHPNEFPVHPVTLSDFYIGKYEVTQGQWIAVMGNNPSNYRSSENIQLPTDNYPVETVSWNDIVGTSGATMVINNTTYYEDGFIYRLNQMTGKQYRLPTEAEWEFAERGGLSSEGFKYCGSNTVDDVAWPEGSGTHEVGKKSPNELGIYDMNGNVVEWCSDWYAADYYSISPQDNPTGPSTGSDRVFRGIASMLVSWRFGWPPDLRASSLGFRLVCSSN